MMNALIHILAKSGLLTKDLDYHQLRASMVLIFLAFGYQKWFAYEAQVLIPRLVPVFRVDDGMSAARARARRRASFRAVRRSARASPNSKAC
jgi:hypothetical protein